MRTTTKLMAIAAVSALAACSESRGPTAAASSPSLNEFANQGPGIHIMGTRAAYEAAAHTSSGGGGGTGIFYHGGPVIHGENIVAIYWSSGTIYNGGPAAGTTGSGSQDGSLVGYFMSNLGGTGYWNINTTYYDGAGNVANSLAYTNYWADNTNVPASGTSVSDAAVQQEVIKGFTTGALTYNGNTLYAVFSDAGVNLGGNFGSQYCAYHGHFTWNGNDVKYAVMPHDIDYPAGCTAQLGSPNNDPAADAEVNTLAHETEETETDEDLNAWYDRRGYENADKCAWKWGTTSTASNGASYNQTIGGKQWLIQMNWINANSGGCLQHWP